MLRKYRGTPNSACFYYGNSRDKKFLYKMWNRRITKQRKNIMRAWQARSRDASRVGTRGGTADTTKQRRGHQAGRGYDKQGEGAGLASPQRKRFTGGNGSGGGKYEKAETASREGIG